MHARPMPTSILLLSLLLTGCTATAPTGSTNTPPPPTATGRPTPDTAPSPTSAPATAGELIITLDAVEYRQDGRVDVLPLDQPDPLVALIEQLTGQPPIREDIEDPWGNGDVYGTLFTWSEVTLASLDPGQVTVTFSSPKIGNADVLTAEGVRVGSTLAEVLAAGGWGEWDGDGDGAADSVNIGMRAVSDTYSLSRPGEIGAEFIDLTLDGDRVDRISSPSNDFSDL